MSWQRCSKSHAEPGPGFVFIEDFFQRWSATLALIVNVLDVDFDSFFTC